MDLTVKESISSDFTVLSGGLHKVSQSFWLKPNGELVRIMMQKHEKWAKDYLLNQKYPLKPTDDAQNILHKEGWIAVVLYDIWNDPVLRIRYHLENPPNSIQEKALKMMIDKFNDNEDHKKKITHIQDDTKRTRIQLQENLLNEAFYDNNIWYHGSPSGDLRGGVNGLHLGTFLAAKQALEARIGIPVEDEWDGTRKYGETLLCGKETLKSKNISCTGFNCDAPDEDYYPTESNLPSYSDRSHISLNSKPSIKAYKILCPMTNHISRPYDDFKANGYMSASLKRGNAKSGFYYKNISEDAGNVSVVIPNGNCLREVNPNIQENASVGINKEELIKSRIPHLTDDTLQITISKESLIPAASYVQVDEIINGENIFSSNPETMIKLGYKMPNSQELLKLPTGRYSMSDIKRMIRSLHESLLLEKHKRPDGKKARSFIVVYRYNPSLEVLLVSDKKGRWTLPGGQLDMKENFEDAAWRELKEETNVVPKDLIHWKKIVTDDKITDIYHAEISNKQKAKAGSDARGVKWFTEDKLDDVKDFHRSVIKDVFSDIHDTKKEIEESMKFLKSIGISSKELLTERKKTVDGYLIVMEGIDGAGKSTQCDALEKWLKDKGWKVTVSKWNNSPHITDAIKKGKKEKWLSPTLFSLLNASDMVWRYENVIKPSLEKGHVVICDRFYYTSYVRDSLRGVSEKLLDEIYRNFPEPDLLIHFSVPPELAMKRLMKGKGVKYYSSGRDIGYHENEEKCALEYEKKMDEVYQKILPKVKNYKSVDTERDIKEISKEIKKFVREKLQKVKRSKFKNLIKEMADLHLKGKTVYSGDVSLKELPIEYAKENVVFFRNDKSGIFAPGFTLVYFMDSDESVELMKQNKIPYLMIPRGTFYSGGSPITDLWKKKFQKPGTEHIVGVIEGNTNNDLIYIDMISVRPGWQRNKIATKMIEVLKKRFPNAKIETSSRTEKGEKFYQSIKEGIFPKEFNRHALGSCMSAAQLATEYLLKKGIKDFQIVEGWVAQLGDEDWDIHYNNKTKQYEEYGNVFTHTWIEFKNGRIFNPTKNQWKEWGYNPDEMKIVKTKTKYSPEDYLDLCEWDPNPWKKFKKLEESININERLSYSDLYDATDDKRIERSRTVRVKPLLVTTENNNEMWKFSYTSAERSEYKKYGGRASHKGNIHFFKDSIEPGDNAEDLDCMVDCDCKDFKFRWAYANAQDDASFIGGKSLNKAINRPPIKTNPERKTQLCKHLSGLAKYLTTNIDTARRRARVRRRPVNIFEEMDRLANQGQFETTYNDYENKLKESYTPELKLQYKVIDLRDPNWVPNSTFDIKDLNRTMVSIEKNSIIYLYRWGHGNILPWEEVSSKTSYNKILLTKDGSLILPDEADVKDYSHWPGKRNIYTTTTKYWVSILLDANVIQPNSKIYIGNWASQTGDYIGIAGEISEKNVVDLPDHLTFYHGTSEDRIDDINKDGLKPVPLESRVWKSDVLKHHPNYREKTVYLTLDKSQSYYYAEKAVKVARRHGHRGVKSVVLKVIVPRAAYEKLLPDDDYILKNSDKFNTSWIESLRNFSQVAYLGIIPPQWIDTEYVGKPTWYKGELVTEEIERIGFDPDEEHSDMPIDWDASDVQILDKWNINTIRRYAGLPLNFTAIYHTIFEVNELTPKLAEDEPDAEEEKGGYDWEEFTFKRRGFPPVLLMRNEDGSVHIMDGNHRIHWAQEQGFKTIGAWVVDKLIQKHIDSKKSIKETRIISPEESLEEGYITLYHGTIWPIALRAKKGELGPQNLKSLVTKILVDVFHEKSEEAARIFDKYSKIRINDPQLLFLTTDKETAEKYAKSSTKYGGEIFHDIIGNYLWNKSKNVNQYIASLETHLRSEDTAIVTINVPLSMVFTHPNWNTPARERIRSILKKVRKNPELKKNLNNLPMEVFVKENIPSRFIQRIDKVYQK